MQRIDEDPASANIGYLCGESLQVEKAKQRSLCQPGSAPCAVDGGSEIARSSMARAGRSKNGGVDILSEGILHILSPDCP